MKTAELFCGTKSFSKVAASLGHGTLTFDNDSQFDADVKDDVLTTDKVPNGLDILWASPPCQGFSVAVIGRNWNYDATPKTDSARLAVALAKRTLHIIEEKKPVWWFIENPRGMLRKMPFMEGLTRHTVTYCQYGDTRQKPTDIWTNAHWWKPRPMCSRGATCHVAAPRGSRTGTQGLQGAAERGRVPQALFEEIFAQRP